MNPIKLRRVTIDLSMVQVAKLCGWSQSFQSKIESGNILLSREHIMKLEEVLKFDLSNFYIKGKSNV